MLPYHLLEIQNEAKASFIFCGPWELSGAVCPALRGHPHPASCCFTAGDLQGRLKPLKVNTIVLFCIELLVCLTLYLTECRDFLMG